MTRGPGPLPTAAQALRNAASGLAGVEGDLTGLLADAATTLGWRGDAAQAADVRASRTGTQLDQVGDALEEGARSLSGLAGALETGTPQLARLQEQRAVLVVRSVTERLLDLMGLGSEDDEQAIRGIDLQILSLVDELTAADRRAADRLDAVAGELRRLGALASSDGWVGTAAPQGVLSVLARYGVVTGAADAALLDWADRLPAGAGGDAQLRARLAGLAPDEIADLLLRHPELSQRLLAGLPDPAPAGTPEALLQAVMSAPQEPPAKHIAAVADAFAAMTPDQRRRLALLYPSVVGRLDGAPLDDRMAANRVQIGAALQSERDAAMTYARVVRDRSDVGEVLEGLNDKVALAVEVDDLASAQQRNNSRIAYYQRLLYEEVANPAPGSGRHPSLSHQIVYFDPVRDGAIAEMWGAIDGHARNVAVFVPGTTADLENFSSYADKMRVLAQEDKFGATTTVAWMAVDMPDAVGADAPFPSYALEGGPRLRDFVTGMGIPDGVDVTAIGHSYGGALVGVADDGGLDVDRVLHIESAGAGRDVDSVTDYAPGRDVDRYTMQAPGDPIAISQGQQVGPVGHGGDVNEMDGFTRLETGRYGPDHERAGQLIQGSDAHSGVLTAGSTAWTNMVGVVNGTEVVPRSPFVTVEADRTLDPRTWDAQEQRSPYADPDYMGLPPVPVP